MRAAHVILTALVAVVTQDVPTLADPVAPSRALALLRDGNARFSSGEARRPHAESQWRRQLESGQHPFAVVLACSDSRVAPELVFDQGFGDLFVVRVAGNVVDTDVIASIEYAAHHCQTQLVVVMGHTGCGAVTATLDHLVDAEGEPAEVVSLLFRIEPAVQGIPAGLPREERLAMAVKKNVQLAVRRLRSVPDLRRSERAGRIQVVGAVYDMHTGRVEFLPQPAANADRQPATPAPNQQGG